MPKWKVKAVVTHRAALDAIVRAIGCPLINGDVIEAHVVRIAPILTKREKAELEEEAAKP